MVLGTIGRLVITCINQYNVSLITSSVRTSTFLRYFLASLSCLLYVVWIKSQSFLGLLFEPIKYSLGETSEVTDDSCGLHINRYAILASCLIAKVTYKGTRA